MYLSNTDDWLHHWMILIDIESITDWHWICSLWAVMVYAAPRRGRSTVGLVPRAMEPDCLGMGLIWINRDAKHWAWHWLPFQSVHLQALPTPGCQKDGFSGCVHLIFSPATRRKKLMLTGGFEIVTILAANGFPNGCKLGLWELPNPRPSHTLRRPQTSSYQICAAVRGQSSRTAGSSPVQEASSLMRSCFWDWLKCSKLNFLPGYPPVIYAQLQSQLAILYGYLVPKDGCNSDKGW